MTIEQVDELIADTKALFGQLEAYEKKWEPILGDSDPREDESISKEKREELIAAINDIENKLA